jgi:lipopolysaccharide/colanic/teichoic acid biosynthesis glycosyltransferase
MRQPANDIGASSSLWTRQLVESCLSAIALVVLSPLMLVIAGSIFCETGWPILFAQQRVGRKGRLFRLLKFRTMLYETKGLALTISGDRRVTQVGRFLRHFKLDEIPQLWNVVRAEMALVGPRPEVPEFVDLNDPLWHSVLSARPGITDPASIAYRQEEKLLAKASDPVRYYQETLLPSKLAMNLTYLQHRSCWQDAKMILQTLRCVAYPGNGHVTDATDFSPREIK